MASIDNDNENLGAILGKYREVGKTYRQNLAKNNLVECILRDKTNIINEAKMLEQRQASECIFEKLKQSVEAFSNAAFQLQSGTYS